MLNEQSSVIQSQPVRPSDIGDRGTSVGDRTWSTHMEMASVLPRRGAVPSPGQCHLWKIAIGEQARWINLLSAEERLAASRYLEGTTREIFTTSRGAQRLIAARYLNCTGQDIVIRRDCAHCGGDHGRPRLTCATVDYSISHTRDWLLMAVVGHGAVGIDVENVAEPELVDDLISSTLTPRELAWLSMKPNRAESFTRIWTRKEAVLKLTGHGITADMQMIDVVDPVATALTPPTGWPTTPIHVTDLTAQTGLPGALASTLPIRSIIWRDV